MDLDLALANEEYGVAGGCIKQYCKEHSGDMQSYWSDVPFTVFEEIVI